MLSYSEFLFAQVLSGSADNRQLSVVLAALIRNTDVSWGLLNSGMFLSMIPSVILAAIIWRFVVEGVVEGAVQG